MPIITKTATSSSYPNSYESVALNFANAVAIAIGTEVKKTGDGWNYVSMDSIGYPGWCFVSRTTSSEIIFSIYTTDSEGALKSSDRFSIGMAHISKSVSDSAYKSATCVMLFDENKDSVLFNVHRGDTQHGTDIYVNGESVDFTFFLAKDANNDVLCGCGRLFPIYIRTIEKKGEWVNGILQKTTTIDSLHLTKMVNYLSPGCPEMKSAYVSVVRPLSDASSSEKYVALYEINGIQYGRASYVNSWDPNNIADGKCYYPFDPFVKY